jgi:uncharacterized repeat protein (TIGR01451 family)
MKSWMLRLGALAIFSGVGCLGVMFAQHRFAAKDDAPPPDFSKPPVNAEAVAAMSGNTPGDRYSRQLGAMNSGAPAQTTEVMPSSPDHQPVDPFQGADQTGLGSNYRNSGEKPTASSEANAGDHDIDRRVTPAAYEEKTPEQSGGAATNSGAADHQLVRNPFRSGSESGEPRRLDADPNAAPMAADARAISGAHDNAATAVDLPDAGGMNSTGGASRAIPMAGNDPRYVDSAARKASGIAAATGVVEAAHDLMGGSAATTPADVNAGSRYGNPAISNAPAANPSSPTDNYRQPAGANDLRATSEAQSPNDLRAGSSARGLDSPEAMTSRGVPAAMPNDLSSASALSNSAMPNAVMPNSGSIANLASTANSANGMPIGSSGPVATGANVEGSGRPGDKKFEGAQTPSVTIEKMAPTEIKVGKEATFAVVVRNTGPVLANDVQVTDAVPQGTRLIATTPKTSLGPRGEIVWKVGDMKPGDESKLEVQVMPLEEGEIGSTAVVQFRSVASMRTVATKPELVLDVTAPQQVMIGSDAKMQIKLSNPGTGAASKVVLSAHIPATFQHPAGTELEFEVGEFRPGESRDLDLSLHAVQAGPGPITVAAQDDASLRVEKAANIEVVAPRLEVKLAGPAMRYLDRQAKYTVSVNNPGTASAKNLTLTTQLPKGMQFVEASDSGQYDASSNSVLWGLDELPAGQSGNVTLTALAKEAGDQKVRSEVKAAGGLSDGTDQITVVEGVAAVNFTVAHLEDPVEVGGQATYEIHIVNQGSKAASRLQVVAVFPQEIKPVSGDGPSKQAVEGQRIAFEPLARLAPKADITYRVVGQCLSPGDLRIQVLLQTDDMAKPVIKEEGTRVYKD